MTKHNRVRDEFVPAPRKNLPIRILRAFDNAKHIAALPRSVRDTFAEIVRYVPQNRPLATVFAHKSSLAERIGTSERTIYRHLADLEAKNLIIIHNQERRSRNGRFSVSRIALTEFAAQLLGLIESISYDGTTHSSNDFNKTQSIDKAKTKTLMPDYENLTHPPALPFFDILSSDNSDQTKKKCAGELDSLSISETQSFFIHNEPCDKLSDGFMITKPTNTNIQCPVPLIQGLPSDLVWLAINGVTRAGIFKLMGMAKTKKKRLSDIVLVVKDNIQKLKGKHLYGYLAKLVNGPTCFQLAATNKRRGQKEEEEAKLRKQKDIMFRQRFAGTSLFDRERSVLYRIDEKASYAEVIGGSKHGWIPLTNCSWFTTNIEDGKLVLAHESVEVSFKREGQGSKLVNSLTLSKDREKGCSQLEALKSIVNLRTPKRTSLTVLGTQ